MGLPPVLCFKRTTIPAQSWVVNCSLEHVSLARTTNGSATTGFDRQKAKTCTIASIFFYKVLFKQNFFCAHPLVSFMGQVCLQPYLPRSQGEVTRYEWPLPFDCCIAANVTPIFCVVRKLPRTFRKEKKQTKTNKQTKKQKLIPNEHPPKGHKVS